MSAVLFEFNHGLGDCVQLTSLLAQLRRHQPTWQLHVSTAKSKASLFHNIADVVHVTAPSHDDFQHVFNLSWDEPGNCFVEAPATKAAWCLAHVFRCQPTFQRYVVTPSEEARRVVSIYTRPLGSFVLLHYEGNTACHDKNLSHEIAGDILAWIRQQGLCPVLLDWDDRSPHCRKVINPGKHDPLWNDLQTGDGERLVELCRQASLVIGIDSGPLHCAMATDTPTIGVWTYHHPIHYADYAPNTLHLVPYHHRQLIRGNAYLGEQAFQRYRYRTYHCLLESLLGEASCMLSADGRFADFHGMWIRRDMAEQDAVIVQDIVINDSYRMGILAPGHRSGPQIVVDVGAHIGTFSHWIHKLNPQARVAAVEVAPGNVECLTRNVGEFATVIQAACTYEVAPLVLLDAVFPGTTSTGGSMVCPLPEAKLREPTNTYRIDQAPLRTITLEQIMEQISVSSIDILKLDCEGSEFSILGCTPNLERIGMIVGEYHGYLRWEQLRRERFSDWHYSHVNNGDLGTFHLRNPRWEGRWPT
jgi:FkbM family methyltransferase